MDTIGTARRWSILLVALCATLFSNVFINGVAFLIPTLHRDLGLDLARAGLVSAMPSFGMVLTLIAWGAVVDRIGERTVLALGSALTAAAAFGAAAADSLIAVQVFLLLGGMGPVDAMKSDAGKLFAGIYALVCGLVIVAATGIFLAPILHRVIHAVHAEDQD